MPYANLAKGRRVFAAALAGVVLLATVSAVADEDAEKGRDIVERWQSSVVTVRLVMEQRVVVSGREMSKSEGKNEVTGTIIDPSGLVVVSYFSTSPNELYQQLAAAMGEDSRDFKMESETTDVKIRLPDGKELPAKIVLRDKDLDLAFIRPVEKPAEPLPAVDLSVKGTPELLDTVVVINRLGRVASWATAVYIDRIHAIAEKPRRFYVPGGMGAMESELGCPAFTLDGKVVGILVLRVLPSGGGGMGSAFGGMSSAGMLPVILPSEDILEVAQQASATTE
jgi:hypothetical protein